MRGPHGNGADDADVVGQIGFGGIRPEAGVDEANRFAVLLGNEQPVGIEVGLGKEAVFKQVGGRKGNAPRPWKESFQISARAGGSVLRKRRY